MMVYLNPGESPRRWTNAKARLSFCTVTQDGDIDGVLVCPPNPTPEQGRAIRREVRIPSRRVLTPAQIAENVARLGAAREASKNGG